MLTLWKTDTGLPSIFAEMNRLTLDASRSREDGWINRGIRPAADIVELESGFEVALDVPGIDPKAIQIQVEDQTLTVQAERRPAAPPKDGVVLRTERATGSFLRSFALPSSVDGGRVEARYEAGVLTVSLPKREEAKPRTIQVKVA
jgi:HSP20 family protein